MEHIKNIEIQNFKSIRHCKIDGCKRINVFVGAPNVGKSNILEAMSLYQSSNPLYDIGSSLNGLIRFKDINELHWNSDKLLNISLGFNDNTLLLQRNSHDSKFIKVNGEPFDGHYKEVDFFNLKKCQYFEYSHNESIANSDEQIYYQLRFDKELRDIFKSYIESFNLKLLFINNEEMVLVKMIDEDNYSKIPFKNIAETLKRLLYHIFILKRNENSVLLFEEPEAQMYPPYISKLTSEIIYDENKNQYFIATHSPFVLNDFLENAKEDVQIYIVDNKNGETVVQKMTEEEMHEAYQYGSAFFMNIPNFIKD